MPSIAKVFFDTQIYINAANGQIRESDWDDASLYIRRVGEYWTSPLTVGEILLSIARGEPDYFEAGKARLRRVYSAGSKYFDFARYFVAKTLGLPDKRPARLEDDLGFVIQICLLAESKDELLEEGVPIPYLTRRVRIRLGRFLDEIDRIQQNYVQRFTLLKGRGKINLTPEEWARPILTLYGIEGDRSAREAFLVALNAAYEFEMALFNLARNTNYDLQKNVSDLVDAQQLCYLADPTVVFVTDDSDHKKRLRGSAQSGRILSFRQLLRRAHSQEPLIGQRPLE